MRPLAKVSEEKNKGKMGRIERVDLRFETVLFLVTYVCKVCNVNEVCALLEKEWTVLRLMCRSRIIHPS